MELTPGHKQSEIGEIPSDWKCESLGMHASFRTGPFGSALHKSDYVKDGVPVINPMHIIDGQIVPTAEMTIAESVAQSLAEFRLREGEIVIGRRGDIGRCAVVLPHQSGWLCGTGSMIVRPKDFDPSFLQRVLSSDIVIAAIVNGSVGTTMVNLNQGSLSNLNVQYPPLPEQSAIATALGDVDALLAAQDALIAKKRAIKQGAMQELLTGKRRLPGFGGEWEVRRLGDVLTICHGRDQKDVASPSGEFPILATGGRIGWATCWLYDKPSVLIGRKGTIDRPQYMDAPFWTVDTLFYSELKDDHVAKFFYYRCCMIDWHVYNEASGVPSLNARTIEQIEVSVPSPAEQASITAALDDMATEITALEAQRAKTAQLKQGMMQALLTGRIRLV
ncbi:restriction endonuclease subunit S [Thermomonas fusca]